MSDVLHGHVVGVGADGVAEIKLDSGVTLFWQQYISDLTAGERVAFLVTNVADEPIGVPVELTMRDPLDHVPPAKNAAPMTWTLRSLEEP